MLKESWLEKILEYLLEQIMFNLLLFSCALFHTQKKPRKESMKRCPESDQGSVSQKPICTIYKWNKV